MRRRSGGRHAALGLAGALAWLAATGAAAGGPPCTAEAAFDVAHAIVGQQVGFGIRISRRGDVTALEWIEPPTFPGFRAEWLPDVSEPADAGSGERRYEERRALHPQRAGTLGSTPARLRCRVGDRNHVVAIPIELLRVEEPPGTDRPADYAGLIGPVAIERSVTPQRARLGESVRVAVMLRGEGNLWLAEDPLGPIAAADVFRRRPRDSRQTGPRLVVMRHFAYDVVPLRTGELEIPALRVPYFDAAAREFREARSDAVTVSVGPAAPAGVAPDDTRARSAANARSRSRDSAAPPARVPTRWPWGAAAIALGALALALALALRRLSRTRHRAAAIEAALTGKDSGGDEAAAAVRALRLALAPHVEAAATRTPDEMLANPALTARVAAAVHLLAATERARFDPRATAPDREAIRAAIAQL